MQIDYLKLANKGISNLVPYVPGKPKEYVEREYNVYSVTKLASNENPLGCSPKVRTAISQVLEDIHYYPDGGGYDLKEALSCKYQIGMDQITLGNGSNDVLELIARTFINETDEVIYSQYAFIVYKLVAQALNAKSREIPAKDWGHDLDAMLQAITDKTKAIFIANPNNPTGTILTKEELYAFLKQVPPQVIVVLDEAYQEYTPQELRAPSMEWLKEFPNLIVCRTFSKAYGLAGLRVGFSASSAEISGILNRSRQPFNCNNLALVAAKAALEDQEHIRKSYKINQEGMRQLVDFCEESNRDYIPSMGNFITVRFGPQAGEINNKLLKEGLVVRPIANYGMTEHIRISIGLQEENSRLIDILKRF